MFTLLNPVKSPDLSGYYVQSLDCPMCGYATTAFVTSQQMWEYNQGGYAHDVLSAYDADVRERFISGICGECWNNLFEMEEED